MQVFVADRHTETDKIYTPSELVPPFLRLTRKLPANSKPYSVEVPLGLIALGSFELVRFAHALCLQLYTWPLARKAKRPHSP